jgi:transcriptional regulator with XRE-family HTH domain
MKEGVMSLSEKIKKLMLSHGIRSEAKLAAYVGIAQPTLNRLLVGKTINPNQELLKKIAGFFDVTVDSLLIAQHSIDIYIPENERYHDSSSAILQYLMKDIGNISEGELSRRTGVPQPTIHRILSGKTPNPRKHSIEPLAKFFNVSVDQMLGRIPLSKDRISGTFVSDIIHQKTIPILNLKEVFAWPEILNKPDFRRNRNWLTTDSKINSLSFAFNIDNSTYSPEFKQGTLLIVDSQRKPKTNDFVVYFPNHDQMLIGQINIALHDLTLSVISPEINETSIDAAGLRGVVVEAKWSYINELTLD